MRQSILLEIVPEKGRPGKGHDRGFDPTGETGGGYGWAAWDIGFGRVALDSGWSWLIVRYRRLWNKRRERNNRSGSNRKIADDHQLGQNTHHTTGSFLLSEPRTTAVRI